MIQLLFFSDSDTRYQFLGTILLEHSSWILVSYKVYSFVAINQQPFYAISLSNPLQRQQSSGDFCLRHYTSCCDSPLKKSYSLVHVVILITWEKCCLFLTPKVFRKLYIQRNIARERDTWNRTGGTILIARTWIGRKVEKIAKHAFDGTAVEL
jgi:hypothetical protein